MALRLRSGSRVIALLPFLFCVAGCAHSLKHIENGKACWYGAEYQGRRTASGDIFDKNALTAAHRSLPFDTIAQVTNLLNGRSVKVRINDRGPFVRGRIIDLSEAAARELGMIREGVIPVRIKILQVGRRR
jgi:rare lipoprotein A